MQGPREVQTPARLAPAVTYLAAGMRLVAWPLRMFDSLFECVHEGTGREMPFLRGQGIEESSLCGKEEQMEHGIVVCGIAGPRLCYNLRALGCSGSEKSPKVIPWHRSDMHQVRAGTRRRMHVLVHSYGKGQPCLPSHMSFPESMPVACGGCGLSLESQGPCPGKLIFVSRDTCMGPRPSSAEGWQWAGKYWAPCHCGL